MFATCAATASQKADTQTSSHHERHHRQEARRSLLGVSLREPTRACAHRSAARLPASTRPARARSPLPQLCPASRAAATAPASSSPPAATSLTPARYGAGPAGPRPGERIQPGLGIRGGLVDPFTRPRHGHHPTGSRRTCSATPSHVRVFEIVSLYQSGPMRWQVER